MDDPTSHYYSSGFPKALTRSALMTIASLFLFFLSLTAVGPAAFMMRVGAAILSISILMGFRLSTVPRDADRVERYAMWGLYCYILAMAALIILGVVVVSM